MRTGSGLTRRIGIGLVLYALGTSVVSAAPPPPRGQAVYDAISQAAARGNHRAQELKTAVDAYLGRHNLTAAQLGAPPPKSARSENLGAVRLRIEGSAPWAVRITNDTDLETVAALNSYRQERHGSLAALAAANPTRTIRVVVAPNALYGLSAFVGGLACDCRGASIVVDVFSSSGWLMSSGRQLSGEHVRKSARTLEADLLAQAAASLDQFAAADRQGVRLTVRRIEVDLPASQALVLAQRSDVLLVDPLTDLADAYQDAAALVTVGPGPDAFFAHARLNLGNPLAPGPEPAKGGAR